MLFERIIQTFYGSHWAILPERLDELEAALWRVVEARAAGLRPADLLAFDDDGPPDRTAAVSPYPDAPGDVAVVPVRGTIYPRGGANAPSGATTAEAIGRNLDRAVRDTSVNTVVLDVDSPGGSVGGVPELAAKVRDAARQKNVVAVANHLSASAAYWIASQAREVVATPSSLVGSIGVRYVHTDRSKQLERLGLSVTEFTTSPMKAAGSPFRPLTDEARRSIEDTNRHYHEMFVRAVAAGRDTTPDRVEAQFGRGDVLTAEQALAARMVNRVATLGEVLDDLNVRGAMKRRVAAATA